MQKRNTTGIWVAVRVQRGFISDIRAFNNRLAAQRKEESWRRQMNPDYDESAVTHVHIIRGK